MEKLVGLSEKSWKLSLFEAFLIPAEFPSLKAESDKMCMVWFPELLSPQLKLPVRVSALL